ncbi:hypothetical protein F4777DRAFT_136314 [Nemania sp. FL0916]|nr:hypothetical protein F4777DRAFT_136314 [Nemania sp. FL0916]
MSKVVLVTGATGKQGGAVINALLDQRSEKFTILAVTRDVNAAASQKLLSRYPSIKLIQGNLNDVPTLFNTARNATGKPIWGVFSVQISVGNDVTSESEVRQGRALIDESIAAGVRHFVYSSVDRGGDGKSWDNTTPIPHFRTKYEIEHYLRDVTALGTPGEKMGWTILRPVAFMDNVTPGFPTKVFLAALRNWLGSKRMQWVATRDIGIFAAKVFTHPSEWDHRSIGLAGDELNFDELSQAFMSVTGRPAPVTYSFFGSAMTFMVSELRVMINWFSTDGYAANIQLCRAEHPGLLSFAEWLSRESRFPSAV